MKIKKYIFGIISALLFGFFLENGWGAEWDKWKDHNTTLLGCSLSGDLQNVSLSILQNNNTINFQIGATFILSLTFKNAAWSYKNYTLSTTKHGKPKVVQCLPLTNKKFFAILEKLSASSVRLLIQLMLTIQTQSGIDSTKKVISHIIDSGHLGKIYGKIHLEQHDYPVAAKIELNKPVSYFRIENSEKQKRHDDNNKKYYAKISEYFSNQYGDAFTEDIQDLQTQLITDKTELGQEIINKILQTSLQDGSNEIYLGNNNLDKEWRITMISTIPDNNNIKGYAYELEKSEYGQVRESDKIAIIIGYQDWEINKQQHSMMSIITTYPLNQHNQDEIKQKNLSK